MNKLSVFFLILFGCSEKQGEPDCAELINQIQQSISGAPCTVICDGDTIIVYPVSPEQRLKEVQHELEKYNKPLKK